jgi:hypothetical protein
MTLNDVKRFLAMTGADMRMLQAMTALIAAAETT